MIEKQKKVMMFEENNYKTKMMYIISMNGFLNKKDEETLSLPKGDIIELQNEYDLPKVGGVYYVDP